MTQKRGRNTNVLHRDSRSLLSRAGGGTGEDRGVPVGRASPCQCREGERKANPAAITNAPEHSGQLLHEQQKPHWPHKPSGAPCGDSINSCKLLQTFPTLSTHFMCRVQRDTVSYSNNTCHLHLGRFSSLWQLFAFLAL